MTAIYRRIFVNADGRTNRVSLVFVPGEAATPYIAPKPAELPQRPTQSEMTRAAREIHIPKIKAALARQGEMNVKDICAVIGLREDTTRNIMRTMEASCDVVIVARRMPGGQKLVYLSPDRASQSPRGQDDILATTTALERLGAVRAGNWGVA